MRTRNRNGRHERKPSRVKGWVAAVAATALVGAAFGMGMGTAGAAGTAPTLSQLQAEAHQLATDIDSYAAAQPTPTPTPTAVTPTPTPTPTVTPTPTPTPTPTTSGSVTLPPVAGTFDYQIGGAYTPGAGVAIVDRDRTDAPVAGKYNICYINAFQSQPGESGLWGSLLLRTASGALVQDPGWPGEYVVDTRQAAGVASFVGAWINGCAAKGYKAVELDNFDSYTRSGGLLTAANAVDVLSRLVTIGHAAGVAVAQKNASDLSATAKAAGADFAVAEQCQQYTECPSYTSVYGAHVIEIEYKAASFTAACSARSGQISVILRDVNVVPAGQSGYVYKSC